jgi:hypothetical protein
MVVNRAPFQRIQLDGPTKYEVVFSYVRVKKGRFGTYSPLKEPRDAIVQVVEKMASNVAMMIDPSGDINDGATVVSESFPWQSGDLSKCAPLYFDVDHFGLLVRPENVTQTRTQGMMLLDFQRAVIYALKNHEKYETFKAGMCVPAAPEPELLPKADTSIL